jgi:hypothetical protein
MLHVCIQKFNVTENLKKFSILGATKHRPARNNSLQGRGGC